MDNNRQRYQTFLDDEDKQFAKNFPNAASLSEGIRLCVQECRKRAEKAAARMPTPKSKPTKKS